MCVYSGWNIRLPVSSRNSSYRVAMATGRIDQSTQQGNSSPLGPLWLATAFATPVNCYIRSQCDTSTAIRFLNSERPVSCQLPLPFCLITTRLFGHFFSSWEKRTNLENDSTTTGIPSSYESVTFLWSVHLKNRSGSNRQSSLLSDDNPGGFKNSCQKRNRHARTDQNQSCTDDAILPARQNTHTQKKKITFSSFTLRPDDVMFWCRLFCWCVSLRVGKNNLIWSFYAHRYTITVCYP